MLNYYQSELISTVIDMISPKVKGSIRFPTIIVLKNNKKKTQNSLLFYNNEF